MCDDVDSGGSNISTDTSSDMGSSDTGTECTELDSGDSGLDDTYSDDTTDTSDDGALDCDNEALDEGTSESEETGDSSLSDSDNFDDSDSSLNNDNIIEEAEPPLEETDGGLDSDDLAEAHEDNDTLDNDGESTIGQEQNDGIDQSTGDLDDEALTNQPKKDNIDNKEELPTDNAEETDSFDKHGLSDEQKNDLRNQTGWSDNVLDNIRSPAEADIYKNAGLQQNSIDGKDALTRGDIDINHTDKFGRSNYDRMNDGLAPVGIDGKSLELHHIGQHADSPLAELTMKEHRQCGNDTVLHDKNMPSEAHGEGNNWDNERQSYWRSRAKTF